MGMDDYKIRESESLRRLRALMNAASSDDSPKPEPEKPFVGFESFEREFQDFIARGGFEQPCASEQWQRNTQQPKSTVRRCPHGKTYLTCSWCYFNTGRTD